jgi:hypothetical protein
MGQLERRAEAISEIQSSSTRRLLQTRCGQLGFFCVQFNLVLQFCSSFSCISLSIDFDDEKTLRQVLISSDMIGGLHADLTVNVQTLKEKLGPSCQAAFIGTPVHRSASQQQVRHTLRGHGSVGGGRVSMPQSHRTPPVSPTAPILGSGVRRALSFFDVHVASWWDLDEAAAS